MTYYFISFEAAKFREFPERFPVLRDGIWVDSLEDLKEILMVADENSCFFLDLPKSNNKDADQWASFIRTTAPLARLVYVTTDWKPQDLKAHQLSDLGGDAYISKQVSAETLARIVGGFSEELTNVKGNKLEKTATGIQKIGKEFELSSLQAMKEHPLSRQIDRLFSENKQPKEKPKLQSISNFAKADDEESGVSMSQNDDEISLDDMGELEISETPALPDTPVEDEGLDLDMGVELASLDLDEAPVAGAFHEQPAEELSSFDLGEPSSFSLESNSDVVIEDEPSGLHLSDGTQASTLDFGPLDGEVSSDVKDKLAEIDAIMHEDSKINLEIPAELNALEVSDDLLTGTGSELDDNSGLDLSSLDNELDTKSEDENLGDFDLSDGGFKIADIASAGSDDQLDSDLDQPLVSDDLDLANLDFGMEAAAEAKPVVAASPKEEKTSTKIKKKKEVKEEKEEVLPVRAERPMGQELREISGAYSAELERMQATLSNLRSDREELLSKIQTMEEEKLLHNRQTLNMRAELDEKKIELSIVRKKMNEEISGLKDRVRLEEERRLILEEKNRILREEVDKSTQKNRIDVKKVQLHERELEQRLELLKADSETQIRNRDLKILELKRKIDGMEFDMESMQSQEKRTVESRFELEDKLEKAIKTLRNAISVLEDETDKGAVLEALKKNIDM